MRYHQHANNTQLHISVLDEMSDICATSLVVPAGYGNLDEPWQNGVAVDGPLFFRDFIIFGYGWSCITQDKPSV